MAKIIKGVSLVMNPNMNTQSLQKVLVRYEVGLSDDSDMRAYKEFELAMDAEQQADAEALLALALSQAEDSEGI